MGRGLSNLQKNILVLAWRNIQLEKSGANLYAREVMEQCYRFEGTFFPEREVEQDYTRRDKPVRERRGWVFEKFNKFKDAHHLQGCKINPYKYNAGAAAISRAFDRLEKRGLVSRVKRKGDDTASINLTVSGIEEARLLEIELAFASKG